MSDMLTALHEDGRLDLLREIRDGRLAILEVYDAYRRRALQELPVGEGLRPVAGAMKAWIRSLVVPRDYSRKHVQSLESSRRYFERAKAAAIVAELPELLERLRESLGCEHPRSFNLARSAALAFLRAKVKRSHPLYLQAQAVERRKEQRRESHRPLSVEDMRAAFPSPQTDRLDEIAWSMATTGMHQAEFWGRWSIDRDRIHIEGTKRRARVRDVPLIWLPVVPRLDRRTFEDRLRERTRAFVARDLRRTYANWLEAAGIPRTRRKLYMGHSVGDVTGLYELHEVTAFLAGDAEKLRVFLGLPTIAHTLKLEKAEGA
jgi:hypothetical protein